jgi:subtilisin family serine protease
VEDHVSVSTNEAGERVRSDEAMLVTERDDVSERLTAEGFKVIEAFRLDSIKSNAIRVAVPRDMTQERAFKALRAIDPKGIATFNHIYSPARGGGGVALSPAKPAVPSVQSAAHAKIGLVDAGVNASHPMLREVTVNARAFEARAPSVEMHGTAVVSRIAEAAPGVTVFAANVFTRSIDGQEIATADAIVRGLDWLAKLEVPVINLSLTGPANPILEVMASQLSAKGHVLVAAVGNEGPRGVAQYPAAYANVVGVTAVDAQNRVYRYANQGEYVDFAAQGVEARVADSKDRHETVSGTSYASPIVAAALALLIDKPDPVRADAALKALQAQARDLGAPGRDPVYGYGLVRTKR